MEVWLWALAGGLLLAVAGLLAKIYWMRKAAREIREGLEGRLAADTNTLLDLSSRDKELRRLAAALNGQLRRLRARRQRFEQGDLELKNAVTNISHDLRTPLTAICGYLDLLKGEEVSPAARRYLGIVEERADLLKRLTEELFRYSVALAAPQALTDASVSLNRALEESVAGYYAALKARGIAPVIHLPENPVLRRLDAGALARVFANLMANALQYSGGDLEISLTEKGEVVFENAAPALSEVQLGKLFDRFYTVEEGRKSTGLGLSIARALTEQMGGAVAARYEGGRLSIHLFFPEKAPESD